jgi:ABC-type transport system substrate-binding protein
MNRANALLEEAGWVRTAAGLVSAATGEPFGIEARTTTGTDNEIEVGILTAGLRQLGMQVTQNTLSEAAQRDNEYRVTFPGLNSTARSIRVPATMGIWVSGECPDPRQNFRGTNRGCWRNAEYDRLFVVASSSLDPAERARALADGTRIITEEVGVLGMAHNSENLAVRRGLTGPSPRSSEQVGNTWNVHEWQWTR